MASILSYGDEKLSHAQILRLRTDFDSKVVFHPLTK